MRLESSFFIGEHQTFALRRNRLERLLRLWRAVDSLRFDRESAADRIAPTLSSTSLDLWKRFILEAEVIPPRDVTDGADGVIASHNEASPSTPWSREQLEQDGSILVLGKRVAWKNPGPDVEQPYHVGWSWSFKTRLSTLYSELNGILSKQFRGASVSGDFLYASEPLEHNRSFEMSVLIEAAYQGADLFDLWQRASVLGIAREFSLQVGEPLRAALTKVLRKELLANSEQLDLATELTLAAFAEPHWSQDLMRSLPPSRLGALLDTEKHWFQPDSIGDRYFDDVAVSLIECAAGGELDAVLRGLPDGETLRAMLRNLRDRRPSSLSTSLVSFHSVREVLTGILHLRTEIYDGSGQIDLRDEWGEVQLLARRVFIADQSVTTDPLDVHTLGIFDERNDVERDDRKSEPRLRAPERLEAWRVRLLDEKEADRMASTLIALMRRADWTPDDAAFRYWLRLIEITQGRHPDIARRLAEEFVDAYAAGFGVRHVPIGLHDAPELLVYLPNVLAHDSAAWKKWLKPFAIEPLLAEAKTPPPETITGGDWVPAFGVPALIAAHARNLLVQAFRVPKIVASELVGEFVDMYATEAAAPGSMRTFTWPQLHSGHGFRGNLEPVLVSLGKSFAILGDAGMPNLQRILDTKPSALELAQLSWGLSDADTLQTAVRPALEAALAEFEARQSVELGEAIEMARALYNCGIYAAGKRAAEVAVRIVKDFNLKGSGHAEESSQLLVACLAALGDWPALLKVANELPSGRSTRNNVENLMAVAHMNANDFDGAEQLLRSILSRDPDNKLALSNMSALYANRRDWENCREAGYAAVDQLGDDVPHIVWQNIAIAEQSLGNTVAAATAIQHIPRSAASQPSIITLRAELSAALPTTYDPHLEADLRKLETVHPEAALPARRALDVIKPRYSDFEYQVFTEDDKFSFLHALLAANGGDASKIDITSYRGADKASYVADRLNWAHKHFPSARLIVHRDSDYLMPAELEEEAALYKGRGGHLFATAPLEIEGYFCRLDHLIELNSEHAELLRRIHPETLAECRAALRDEAVRGRVDVLIKRKKKDTRREDVDAAASAWAGDLDFSKERWTYGKLFLKRIRERFQKETGTNLNTVKPSPFLRDPLLESLLKPRP